MLRSPNSILVKVKRQAEGHAVPLEGRIEQKLRDTNKKPYVAIAFESEFDGDRISVPADRVRIVIEALAAEPGSVPRR